MFKIKNTAPIFVVILFISSSVFAEKTSKQEQQTLSSKVAVFKSDCYDASYRFVDKFNNALVPIYDMATGWILGGNWGMAIGGMLGTIDESLIYFGYTDKHYLSWGILGATASNLMQFGKVADIVGAVVGIVLPTGAANQYLEYAPRLVAPAISAVAGKAVFGTPGMIGGGIAGILDELSIRNKLTDKHYLTASSLGLALSGKGANVECLKKYLNPWVINGVGTILGMVAAEYENLLVDTMLEPINKGKTIYDTYGKFIPKEQLNQHFENKFIGSFSAGFLMHVLSLKISEYENGVSDAIVQLGSGNNNNHAIFNHNIIRFAVFIVPYVISPFVNANLNNYYDNRLKCTLQDQIKSEIYSGEVFPRFKNNNATVLIDNFQDDISRLIGSSSAIEGSIISAITQGINGSKMLVIYSSNMFMYSIIYSQAMSYVSKSIERKRKNYVDETIRITSEWQDNLKHDEEGVNIIVEKDGLIAANDRDSEIIKKLREAKGMDGFLERARNSWVTIDNVVDFLISQYLIHREITTGNLKFADRSKVSVAMQGARQLFYTPNNILIQMESIDTPLNNFLVIEGMIHAVPDAGDKIDRLFHEGRQLILQDLKISQDDHKVVDLSGKIKFDLGKVYAITGADTKANNNLLLKIKGIKENGIAGTGKIIYPKINDSKAKIIFYGKDYFQLHRSLQEVIVYPGHVPDDKLENEKQREGILRFLEEINFPSIIDGSLNLDSREKEWANILSSEEIKMVDIVSAIIKKPDILLLSGTFDSLSREEMINVQQMLKKYLPNALILVMDHNAYGNNYNEFYDQELFISDGKMVLKDFESAM